jgi:hypothetical protein
MAELAATMNTVEQPVNSSLSTTPNPQSTVQSPSQATNGAISNTESLELDVICGPLINYGHISNELTADPIWHGSVLIVTNPDTPQPSLRLGYIGSSDNSSRASGISEQTVSGEKLYQDFAKSFWRFKIQLPIQDHESNWQYTLIGTSKSGPKTFTVPSKTQSTRILFHSCNGFSVGTDEESYNGPVLWKDVLRYHAQKPFHVMIGGGDQIYNDNVRVTGPLKEWTDISSRRRRREYVFDEELRRKCDEHYYNNYIRWYSTDPFKSANCVIPQINIWDDHDIIDGFGSYTDHFMQCEVFRGIGGVAHK